MMAGCIGQFAVGQFVDLLDSTPTTEDTTSERKPLFRKGSASRIASFWRGRAGS